ncbi:bifunctional phosphatase PAP2/diacylglycerol kinase family protein [Streptomyces californicus]|uniref:bifunctional phosphatase PAP2/diacylglycerol kinase family protein n=1 Tax=Streptomyces californicus TaxID=67351 RepID=UPI003722E60F
MTNRAVELDRKLFAEVASTRWPSAERWLPSLSRAANHGRLWGASATVLAVFGDQSARRGALRGVGALAIASLMSNTLGKDLAHRRRPDLSGVPLVRRLARAPHTTSFPSGHAASAAAFATGVCIECPRAALLVVPLAAAVAFSRAYVGVHYPSDILAGAALGVGAAFATCHWWPRPSHRSTPQPERVRVSAPSLSGGKGLYVVVNRHSGAGVPGRQSSPDRIRALLPQAHLRELDEGQDLVEVLEQAAGDARRAGGALGVCGGDGTVDAAATVAVKQDLPLAVFPGGTHNHFAKDAGVPAFSDTAKAVENGTAIRADIATASPSISFLNTFSLGAYPELVKVRESWEKRVGKPVASILALLRVLPAARPFTVTTQDGESRLWLLFAGNGIYEPAGLIPLRRPLLDEGLFDLRTVSAEHRLARTRLIASAALGTLHRSRVYQVHKARSLTLEPGADAPSIAYDGEAAAAPARLVLAKEPRRIRVYSP